jgi:hypothetical protein
MSEGEHEVEVENKGIPSEEQGVSVSDLYLRVVMTDSPRKRKQTPIESFENNNILKFSSKVPSVGDNQQIFKETGLRWTESVDK